MSDGLKSDDYYYLKCWVVLVKVGKRVLISLFEWGYPNPNNLNLRESLRVLDGYSNGKYNKDFNKDERKKIESESIDNFDITLLYTLIQRLCRLVPPNEQISVNNVCAKRLSKLLHELKNTRNKFAHPMLGMTQLQMIDYIDEMKKLFIDLLDEAMKEFSVDGQLVNKLKTNILNELKRITDSPLPASTKKQVAIEKAAVAIDEGRKDLLNSYKHMEDISVSPWPYPPSKDKLQKIFLKGKIRHTPSVIAQYRLKEADSSFDFEQILTDTSINSTQSNLILLTGKSGCGKSTFLKYITHSWLNSWDNSIQKIESYDLLIYLDCRELFLQTLKELLAHLMPNTALILTEEELKNIVLSQKCLFLIDNIDELHLDKVNLISEILSSPNNCQIIASATNDISSQLTQKYQHRRTNNFILETLNNENIYKFIEFLAMSLADSSQLRKVEVFMSEVLVHFSPSSEWILNPEILSQLFFNWYFSGAQSSRCSSLTNILLNSFNLILNKLKDRIAHCSVFDVVETHSLNDKLQNFLLELGRIAALSLNKDTAGLNFKTTSQLIIKCQQLDLPANILLSEFLCFRESFDESNFSKSTRVTFPSRMFQEFCSAYHIYHSLISNSVTKTSITDLIKTLYGENTIEEAKGHSTIQKIIKYLVGLLSISHQEILSKCSEEVMTILLKYCKMNSSDWFEIMEESQNNKIIIKRILEQLEDNWKLEDNGISSFFIKLLTRCPPNNLQLTCVKNPYEVPHLEEALKYCARSKTCVNLSLMLYSQFWKDNSGYSDDLLSIINASNSSCKLLNFVGRVKMEGMKYLPTTLRRLALQLNLKDLSLFNTEIQRFPALELLSISVTMPIDSQSDVSTLSRIPLNQNTMFSLDIFYCSEENLTSTARTIAGICPSLDRLSIRKSTYNYKTCLEFLNTLNELGMSVPTVVVGSFIELLPHQLINIKTKSLALVNCKNFKWIVI